jgi:hypothetical protein
MTNLWINAKAKAHREEQGMTDHTSTAADSLIERLDTASDLAPTVGEWRKPVPLTIGGKEYVEGIAAVPIAELVLCSAEDWRNMKPAHRSHRSRRLRKAATDGTFTSALVEALQARGVLPNEL